MCQDEDAFLTPYGDASLRICVKTEMRQMRRCVIDSRRRIRCVMAKMCQKRRCVQTEMRHYEDVSRRRCVFDSIRRCVISTFTDNMCQDGDASKAEMRHSKDVSKAEMRPDRDASLRFVEVVSRRRYVFDSIRRCVITDMCQDGDASKAEMRQDGDASLRRCVKTEMRFCQII